MGKKGIRIEQTKLPFPVEHTYCPDANALIDISHAHLINKLTPFAKTREIRIAEGVSRELQRKSDKLKVVLAKWESKYDIIVHLSEKEKIEFSQIESTYKNEFKIGNKSYPGLWVTPSGKKGIDSQVIVIGKTRGWVVVSNDTSVKGACALESIECITWEEFGRRLGIIK